LTARPPDLPPAYNGRVEPPRFYCPQLAPGEVKLDPAEAQHALRSLRLRPGDAVTLFDGCGHVARAILKAEPPSAPGSNSASTGRTPQRRPPRAVAVIESISELPPPQPALTLIVAACKGPRLDWLVEKCTELGVARLVLAEFAHSVVHVRPQHLSKLHRITIEACKQCGRAWLPELEAGIDLAAAAKTEAARGELFIADPTEAAPSLGHRLAQLRPDFGHLAVVIGPEGGIAYEELALLADVGGQPVRLAKNILRVETACLAVAAVWADLAC
jgi:16S rRNA (uracil1498-N3)-methyltransferase